jgi:hypothetical protein
MDSSRHLGRPAYATLSTADTAPTPAGDEKLGKKELKRLFGESRPLDSWERYRALNDAIDEAYEVTDISNREARFALLVMGILNAFVVLGASRREVVGTLDPMQRTAAAALLCIYAIAAVYFLFQAIEALRPGRHRPKLDAWRATGVDVPVGIRYFEDVIERDVQSLWQAWSQVQVGQLNAELAVQLHCLSLKSNIKRAALARLFAGLRIMAILVVGLIALFVYAAWS